MAAGTKRKTFSVSRMDLFFDYRDFFEGFFKCSLFESKPAVMRSGVILQENLGYDFQKECSPAIEILPNWKLPDEIGGDIGDYQITVLIEDIALRIREIAFSIGLEECKDGMRKPIDLKAFQNLAFYRGFEIRCLLTRKSNLKPNSKNIWHKSQIIHETVFAAKASEENHLFSINWVKFKDEKDKEDVLYFVKWSSNEVSRAGDCFQVNMNRDLQDQFTRLENNTIGEFCVRMMAEQILREIIYQCLKFADLKKPPKPDSLHDRIAAYLHEHDFDFNELAHKCQSGDPMAQLGADSELTKILQRINKVGSTLGLIKFGGLG